MEASNSRDDERVVDAPASPPLPTLTVAAVARRLGVAPPTLRTWDRRYGLGPSAHTAGAHRRYSPGDVARLMVMRRLTLEGVSPADAAKIAIATPLSADGQPMATPADGFELVGVPDLGLSGPTRLPSPPRDDRSGGPNEAGELDEDIVDLSDATVLAELADEWRDAGDPFADADLAAARRAEAADPDVQADQLDEPWRDEAGEESETSETPWLGVLRSVGSGTSGGGRVVAMPDGTPASRGLARAAMSLDTYETSRMLRDAIRRQGVVVTWNSMIMPVLRALGERTAATGDGIDVEHAFSEVVLGVMRLVTLQTAQPRNPPGVLLACSEHDYHSLPLHALAAALAERDVPTRMLGTGLPPQALASAVRRTGPSVVVIFARNPEADAGHIEELRRQRPAPTIVLAGPGWLATTIPSSARTAASLTESIDQVLRALHA
jgi:MerR family transcriptional regulator, light-induced transcriptional regulator